VTQKILNNQIMKFTAIALLLACSVALVSAIQLERRDGSVQLEEAILERRENEEANLKRQARGVPDDEDSSESSDDDDSEDGSDSSEEEDGL
jgi:hypothetical protein